MKSNVVAFSVVAFLAILAISAGFYQHTIAGVVIYDANFDVFRESLSRQQADGIIHSAGGQIATVLGLLIATNAMWFAFGFWQLRRIQPDASVAKA